MSATSYDEIPYGGVPLPHTHPTRMAALAHLFGMTPVAPSRARVLDIGCGSGINLLSIATSWPSIRAVGFDLSGVQIEMAKRVAESAGAGNVEFLQMDLADATANVGPFDYIIAHGVFSWIPQALQGKLLALCKALLAPDGIAYVSYNTLPGWHMRGAARDLMRYHALEFDSPEQRARQARGILEFVAAHAQTGNEAYRTELALIQNQPDYYILHEQLEGANFPLYFHEFIARAQEHGLQYLCETELHSMMADAFAPEVQAILQRIASDSVRQEQFMDFLRNRMFRQTLLVNAEVEVHRDLPPSRADALHFCGNVRSATPASNAEQQAETFTSSTGASVTTANPLTRAALHYLDGTYPRAVAFTALLAEAHRRSATWAPRALTPEVQGVLAVDLLRCVLLGLLEVQYEPLPCVEVAGPRPATSALARAQAAGSDLVATLRHEPVDLDAPSRAVLALLDGTRDRARLLNDVPAVGSAQALEALLARFAAAGLLRS